MALLCLPSWIDNIKLWIALKNSSLYLNSLAGKLLTPEALLFFILSLPCPSLPLPRVGMWVFLL